MTDLPRLVSVVIPARDGSAVVDRCLGAVFAQDHEGPIEVIVAVPPDDRSRERLATYGSRVTVVDNPSGTTPAGLNAAIAASRGQVVVRCDVHATLAPDYVSTALRVLDETGAAVVGGIQRPVGVTLLQRAVAIAQSTPIGVGDARYRLGGEAGPVDTVYLGVFRREVLDEVGGYSEDLERTQDYELNHRIREAGAVVWFDPRLVVEYSPRRRLGALWRQYFGYGRWRRRVLRRHPGSLRWRQLAAPLLVVGLIASAGAAAVGGGLVAGLIPAIYGAGLLLTAVVEAVRRREPAAVIVPAPLVVMHLAWGLGFLTAQFTRRR